MIRLRGNLTTFYNYWSLQLPGQKSHEYGHKDAQMDGEPLGASWGQLGSISLEKKRLWWDLTAALQYLRGAYRKKKMDFLCRQTETGQGAGFKLNRGRFRWAVRKKFFTMRVPKHWNWLLREVVNAPSLEWVPPGWDIQHDSVVLPKSLLHLWDPCSPGAGWIPACPWEAVKEFLGLLLLYLLNCLCSKRWVFLLYPSDSLLHPIVRGVGKRKAYYWQCKQQKQNPIK